MDILKEISMLDCKPGETHMDLNVKLVLGQGGGGGGGGGGGAL